MKKFILISVITLTLIMSCSCSKLFFLSEDLSMPKQAYTGKELRIDGYYYYQYSPNEKVYYSTYFLFENGIILYGGAVNETEISRLENDFITSEWQNAVKKYKDGWGLFNINDDKILFERWYPNSPGKPRVYIREGEILNDTTFHITVSYRPDGSERRRKNEMYHFKQFSPKPDSTNSFIK